MAFTYNPGASTLDDITRVRFRIADTVESAKIFDDDEITMMITEEGTWQKAVIACLNHIIMKISAQPDFTADWLNVTLGRSLEGYKMMLSAYSSDFNLSIATATAIDTYRKDSFATDSPDYDGT